jgi:hypothetical protein
MAVQPGELGRMEQEEKDMAGSSIIRLDLAQAYAKDSPSEAVMPDWP